MVNSKRKGAVGEREFSKLCQEHGYRARRGQQYNGLEGEDVVGIPGVHVEVKRVEKLNIHDAMQQSVRDADPGTIPIVAHRKNNTPWLVTMPAEEFLRMRMMITAVPPGGFGSHD
jgi:Holliday junction resolvase